VSRRPTKTPYAEIRLGYASYKHSDLEAVMSGPLNEDVGFRLSGQWEKQTKGWIDNVIPGQPDEGGVIDQWWVEGQVQVKFNDRLGWTSANGRITLIAYGKNIANTIGHEAGAASGRRSVQFDGPPYGFPYQGPTVEVLGVDSTYFIAPPRIWGVELQCRFL
jgi:hypothetical protein